MNKSSVTTAAAAVCGCIIALATSPVLGRDQIRIVGSSTVFPFSTTVAERFGKKSSFKTPVVESTGSGGGLKFFCSGVGLDTPDIANVSRRIKVSEFKKCKVNNVKEIIEVKVGYDGIVLANSRKSNQLNISLKDIFLALAKNVPNGNSKTKPNTYKTWADVNPSLPNVKIEVIGPPPTSGTRDAFTELALEGGCKKIGWIKAMEKTDKAAYKKLCHTIREDGAYIEAGENDNLIVQKLQANPSAFGILGYSFLDQNFDRLQGSLIDSIAPEFENIASTDYPVSRSLYFYVKKSHIGKVPGIKEYMIEFSNEATWGPEGYLAEKGLIPMDDDERKLFKSNIEKLKHFSM